MKIAGVQPYYERDGIAIYHGDCRIPDPRVSASICGERNGRGLTRMDADELSSSTHG